MPPTPNSLIQNYNQQIQIQNSLVMDMNNNPGCQSELNIIQDPLDVEQSQTNNSANHANTTNVDVSSVNSSLSQGHYMPFA